MLFYYHTYSTFFSEELQWQLLKTQWIQRGNQKILPKETHAEKNEYKKSYNLLDVYT